MALEPEAVPIQPHSLDMQVCGAALTALAQLTGPTDEDGALVVAGHIQECIRALTPPINPARMSICSRALADMATKQMPSLWGIAALLHVHAKDTGTDMKGACNAVVMVAELLLSQGSV